MIVTYIFFYFNGVRMTVMKIQKNFYKITLIVCALWLVKGSVCMRVCKQGCGVKMFCFSRANQASTNLKKFSSSKLFYKSNRKRFSCVCIAWCKHSRRWENSRQLCKPSTSSRVCITVSNSPSPSRVYIRLCKHRKCFLLLK